MTFINYASREINCKIVYYGPGLCGKTTNLQYIYDKTNPNAKGKLISLATETDRTLFFDFLHLELGTVRGFRTRFHLYTVPGQVFYDASRKLILKGVDGVIFDERSSLGLVRLRVKKASQELGDVFARIMSKVEREKAAAGAAFESPFAEITDEDIDSLFSE